ncbi:MAG: GNAT family N-acetyltransferase [Actinomycetota bacterium]
MGSESDTIRSATLADLAGIERCVDAAYRPYLADMATPPAPMLDDYAELVGRGVVDVIDDDGDLAGVLVSWAESDHYYIDNIAVGPDRQGRGCGAALIDHATETAKTLGLGELRLYTNEAMTANLSYYPSRGFTETHRSSDQGYRRVYFSKAI